MSDEGLKEHPLPAICKKQKEKTVLVELELKQLAKRLSRQKVAPTLMFCSYGFNCEEHGVKGGFHLDYCASGGRTDIPGSLAQAIAGVEHLLAELKAKLQ